METEKQRAEQKVEYFSNLKKTFEERIKILDETIALMGAQEYTDKNLDACKILLEANNHKLDKINCEKEIIAKAGYVKMYEAVLSGIAQKEAQDTANCEKYWDESVKTMNEIPEAKLKKLAPALQTQFNEIKKDNANPDSIIYKEGMQHNKNARFQLMTKMIHHLQGMK